MNAVTEEKNDFKIIVIDDNPAIHNDFMKILTQFNSPSDLDELSLKIFGKHSSPSKLLPNFTIDTASQGQEGVQHIKEALRQQSPYSLAFVDIRMPPGWDGIETIKHIWEIDKDIQVVICTAYSDYSWEETIELLGKTDNLLILKKPFDNISVRQLACALTKKWQLLQETRKFTNHLKDQVHERTVSLKKSLSLLKATLESSDEGIIVLDNDKNIIDFNLRFCDMWGISQDIIRTMPGDKLETEMMRKLAISDQFQSFLDTLYHHGEAVNIDQIIFKDGRIFDCYSQPQKLGDEITGRVLNFRDITQRIKLENDLQYQANHDSLTGLPNRIMLLDKIRDAIAQADKNSTLFSVMFIDLDRFKLINDSLTHEAGDDLLKQTAQRLQAMMRDQDTLARLGGDEFVAVLTGVKSEDELIAKANSLIRAFQSPFKLADRTVTVTASIGASIYPKDGSSTETLLRNSDAAMYSIKESGANAFRFYTREMSEKSLERLDQEMRLREALNNHEFILCYQPEMDLINNKIVAVEALIRWNHPEKGILLPLDFIPLAESTGLIIPLGEWILRTACAQNKKWQDLGFPPIRVAVNLSAQQISQQNLVTMIKDILQETGLKPEYLELELTENIVISHLEVMRTINALKELGVTIAVDDFGTGYSSLSYLKKLPLDRLKIDGSFIKQIHQDKDDEFILRAIIALAKNLKLDVLAEGVETQNQINFLKNQKCDEIQGYFYSKPLSVEQFEQILNDPSVLLQNEPTNNKDEEQQ